MKSIILTGILLWAVSMAEAQVSNLIPNYSATTAKLNQGKSINKHAIASNVIDSTNLTNDLPLIRIGGLGSLSNAADGSTIDPAASINMEFSIPGKKHTGLYRNIRVLLSYNIGSAQDSSTVDSVKLGSFFFPDKSKSGFAAGLTCDVARLIPVLRRYSMESVGVLEDDKQFTFYTLEPYVEYAYFVRKIKDLQNEVPRIESNTWLLGMRASLQYMVDNNTFAILLNGYKKWITFSENTYPTYNAVFKKANGDQAMPKNNALWGINVGLQFKKAILGFTYENLTTKGIVNKDIAGGTFILKATLSADFLEFK